MPRHFHNVVSAVVCIYTYIYIYVFLEREREREREKVVPSAPSPAVHSSQAPFEIARVENMHIMIRIRTKKNRLYMCFIYVFVYTVCA